MGKYIEQAGSYNQGIKMLKNGLENTVLELEKVKKMLLFNKSSNDALTYYVEKFNKDILEEVQNLILKSTSLSFSIYQKAKELDERQITKQSETDDINKIIDTNVVIKPSDLRRKVGGYYGR